MMNEIDFKNLYDTTKNSYYSIKYIASPHFPTENIFFGRQGFIHMIYKGKILRERRDQIHRFESFHYVTRVLSDLKSSIEYREEVKFNTTAKFWGFSLKIEYRVVTVVVRQIDDGKKHFFSVMSKKTKALD